MGSASSVGATEQYDSLELEGGGPARSSSVRSGRGHKGRSASRSGRGDRGRSGSKSNSVSGRGKGQRSSAGSTRKFKPPEGGPKRYVSNRAASRIRTPAAMPSAASSKSLVNGAVRSPNLRQRALERGAQTLDDIKRAELRLLEAELEAAASAKDGTSDTSGDENETAVHGRSTGPRGRFERLRAGASKSIPVHAQPPSPVRAPTSSHNGPGASTPTTKRGSQSGPTKQSTKKQRDALPGATRGKPTRSKRRPRRRPSGGNDRAAAVSSDSGEDAELVRSGDETPLASAVATPASSDSIASTPLASSGGNGRRRPPQGVPPDESRLIPSPAASRSEDSRAGAGEQHGDTESRMSLIQMWRERAKENLKVKQMEGVSDEVGKDAGRTPSVGAPEQQRGPQSRPSSLRDDAENERKSSSLLPDGTTPGMPDLVVMGPEMRPVPPKLVNSTGSSVTVRWHVTRADAVRFELQYRPKGSAEWRTVSRGIHMREFTLQNLPAGREFFLRVRARFDGVWGPWSAPSAVLQTVQLRPARPGHIRCLNPQMNQMSLAWASPADRGSKISMYTVLCGIAPADPTGEADMTVLYSGPQTRCDALNLSADTRYVFRVIATNSFGDSDVGPPSFGSTSAPPTDVPLRIVADWSEWWDAHHRATYFVNERTGETTWELPSTLNMALRTFGEWTEFWDETSQHCFYYNSRTGDKRWDPPSDLGDLVEAEVKRAEELNAKLEEEDSDDDLDDEDDENDVSTAPKDTSSPHAAGETGVGGAGGTDGHIRQLGGAQETDDTSNKVTAVGKVSRADIEFRKRRFKLLWHARIGNVRPGNVFLDVRRDQVVGDSLAALERFSPTELQQKLVVRFANEEGIDSGGLTKDWCLLLSRKTLSVKAGLFESTGPGFYEVKPSAAARRRSRKSLRLLGRFIGKAVFDRQLVDMPLSAGTCRFILSQEPELDDLLEADVDLHKGLQWVLENDITDIIDSTFSVVAPRAQMEAHNAADRGKVRTRRRSIAVADVEVDQQEKDDWEEFEELGPGTDGDDGNAETSDGAARRPPPPPGSKGGGDTDLVTVDLMPGGRDVEVTEENKHEYVKRMVWWRLQGQCSAGIAALAAGVWELLPKEVLTEFSVEQLRALINGRDDVDIVAMRRTTNFTGGLERKDKVVRWLWRTLASMNQVQRGKFLKFCTGTARVPLDGFDPPFTITGASDLGPTSLPRAHTCFNQLVLPMFDSYATLRSKLTFAIENSDGFQLS